MSLNIIPQNYDYSYKKNNNCKLLSLNNLIKFFSLLIGLGKLLKMSSEKNDLLTLIEKTIDYDLSVGDFNNIQTYWNLPGFLVKQGNNFYNLIVSNKYSIQAIFSDASLSAYFSNNEGSDINSLNGNLNKK